jgi:hypothetical protein
MDRPPHSFGLTPGLLSRKSHPGVDSDPQPVCRRLSHSPTGTPGLTPEGIALWEARLTLVLPVSSENRGLAVERVVEREVVKFRCDQRYGCHPAPGPRKPTPPATTRAPPTTAPSNCCPTPPAARLTGQWGRLRSRLRRKRRLMETRASHHRDQLRRDGHLRPAPTASRQPLAQLLFSAGWRTPDSARQAVPSRSIPVQPAKLRSVTATG